MADQGAVSYDEIRAAALAHKLAVTLPANPATTTGLRKLLEAKDCIVRAALADPIAPRSSSERT